MSTKNREYLTLDKLLFNTPEDIEVLGLGVIKIREPTRKERLDSRIEAKQTNYWDKLSEQEREEEWISFLIPKIIVEPKLSKEDFDKLPVTVQEALAMAIANWLQKKQVDLIEGRRGNSIENFSNLKTQ